MNIAIIPHGAIVAISPDDASLHGSLIDNVSIAHGEQSRMKLKRYKLSII
jgi:hypothetical protein